MRFDPKGEVMTSSDLTFAIYQAIGSEPTRDLALSIRSHAERVFTESRAGGRDWAPHWERVRRERHDVANQLLAQAERWDRWEIPIRGWGQR